MWWNLPAVSRSAVTANLTTVPWKCSVMSSQFLPQKSISPGLWSQEFIYLSCRLDPLASLRVVLPFLTTDCFCDRGLFWSRCISPYTCIYVTLLSVTGKSTTLITGFRLTLDHGYFFLILKSFTFALHFYSYMTFVFILVYKAVIIVWPMPLVEHTIWLDRLFAICQMDNRRGDSRCQSWRVVVTLSLRQIGSSPVNQQMSGRH